MSAETESPELLDALWEIELQYDLGLHYARFRAFMLDCLALIEERWLPPIAVEALDVARRFQAGDAPAAELTAERVRCWQHLRERGHTSQLEDDETVAIRATLCALYAEPGSGETAGDLLPWFLVLVNRLEDRSSDELALLKRHFPR
jgi:hypothetical protein